jgi:hypothetical protein
LNLYSAFKLPKVENAEKNRENSIMILVNPKASVLKNFGKRIMVLMAPIANPI